MMKVKEVSETASVSVRTLHYYDQIGLLCPERVTEAGYRLYGSASLERLQRILLLRELEFPLKVIKEIVDAPESGRDAAMEQQIRLLNMKRDRLNRLISLAENMRKGEIFMDFSVFDKSEIEQYKEETKQRWENTEAYAESERRTAGYTKDDWNRASGAVMGCFAGFGRLRKEDAGGAEAQAQVKKLQDAISDSFYNCTKEILASLGQMYTSDPRFRASIDSVSGEGTAEFAARAIEVYCR